VEIKKSVFICYPFYAMQDNFTNICAMSVFALPVTYVTTELGEAEMYFFSQ